MDVERGNDEESSNHSHPPIPYTQKLNKRPFTYSIGGAPFKTFISLNRWMDKKQSRQKFENITPDCVKRPASRSSRMANGLALD